MPTRREVLAFTGLAALTGASATSALAGEPVWTPGVKTFSTAQKQVNILSAEKETVIFERKGPGCITHMWFGGNWPHFNQTRVRFYVDGQAAPSIDMEYGLGHGIGFDDTAAPWGVRQMGMTGHVGGLYNTFRIPFGKAIRITSQLAPGVRGNPYGWWIIRGAVGLPVQIGGITLPDTARLKLYKRTNLLVPRLAEFDLLKTNKDGALFLVTMAASSPNLNYMEGCMRGYFAGSKEPELLSSGLEDYFCGTYYFASGMYHTPVGGLTHNAKIGGSHQFSAYRFHDTDPIFFRKGFRLTGRCGETLNGKVLWNPQATTYNTYAWAYEW